MGVKVVDLKQSEWYIGCLDDDIPSDDIVFLVTYFVLSNKDMIYEFVDVKERGRPINPPEYMIALLFMVLYVILMELMNWLKWPSIIRNFVMLVEI